MRTAEYQNVDDPVQYIMKIANSYPLLTTQEEYEFGIKKQNGDKIAYEKFFFHNLRLVIYITNRYKGRGVEIADLMQEGMLGLQKAIEHYKPEKGTRFSTFAVFWIKKAIVMTIEKQGQLMKVSAGFITNVNKLKIKLESLEKELGYSPNEDELSEILDIPKKSLQKMFQYMKSNVSLNSIVYTEENQNVETLEFLSSDSYVEEDIITRQENEGIVRLLFHSQLNDHELYTILLRAGFISTIEKISLAELEEDIINRTITSSKDMSFEEIGRIIGKSDSTARNYWKNGLRKIKKNKATTNI